MLGEILAELFGEAVFSRFGASSRAQLVIRWLVGLLGTGLGVAGAFHVGGDAGLTDNVAMRASAIGLFVALSCFSLLNVTFATGWRWPGRLFVLCFVLLFVTRILFGP